MKCKQCKYFSYERNIQFYSNSPVITLGTCSFGGRDFGNKTMSISESCKNFVCHGQKISTKRCFPKQKQGVVYNRHTRRLLPKTVQSNRQQVKHLQHE